MLENREKRKINDPFYYIRQWERRKPADGLLVAKARSVKNPDERGETK